MRSTYLPPLLHKIYHKLPPIQRENKKSLKQQHRLWISYCLVVIVGASYFFVLAAATSTAMATTTPPPPPPTTVAVVAALTAIGYASKGQMRFLMVFSIYTLYDNAYDVDRNVYVYQARGIFASVCLVDW